VSSFVHVRVGGWDVIGAQVQSAALCTKYVFVVCVSVREFVRTCPCRWVGCHRGSGTVCSIVYEVCVCYV